MLIAQYLLIPLPHTCLLRGILVLLLFLSTCYESARIVASFLLRHCLVAAPPPWAQAKTVHHITRRHDRKHGRYKITPRYQMVRMTHIIAFIQCMLSAQPDHINNKVATILRHTPWATTAQHSPFKLEYYDVSITLPKSYIFKTSSWGSPATQPFCLPEIVSCDGLFSHDDDPSDIVHLMNFDLQPYDFGSTSKLFLNKNDMPLYFSLLDSAPCFSATTVDPPLIVDTGASVCITPLKSDFDTYRPSTMRINDLSSSNKVAGEGQIKWHVLNNEGKQVTITVPGFHTPTAEVRLLSPQLLLNQAGGFSHQTATKIHIHLDSSNDDIDAHYCPRTLLPMLRLLTGETKHSFWASTFDYTSTEALAYPTLLSDTNVNLNAAQKEVLLWHHKLSHASISWIQQLMRDRKWLRDRVNNNESLHSGPFLPCKTKGATCDIDGLKCIACLCAKAQRRSTHSHMRHDPDDLLRFQHQLNGTAQASLKQSHVAPGDCVSADHYLSPFNGRLYSSFGREQRGYLCGTIFVDHSSGKVFNFPQLSNSAVDTIRSKRTLKRLACDEGITIKHIHTDNGVFASAAFRADCDSKSQKLSFSGVGAHHQNGVAERNIKTVSQWARASMLHAAFHWHEHANIKLWPQAVDYAVWIFNRLPSVQHGLSPNELWSRSRNTNHDLRRAHPFGCPVFVLDPALQDGNKIPKWDTRARRGMFVGFSSSHSSLVPLVLNISTRKITPQFHVVFDDKFQTVMSLPQGTTLRDEWLNILAFGNDCFLDVDKEMDDNLSETSHQRHNLPPDFLEWLDRSISPPSSPNTFPPPLIVDNDEYIEMINDNLPTNSNDTAIVPATIDNVNQIPEDIPMTAPEGVTPTPPLRRNPARNAGSWKDGPAKIRMCPIDDEDYDFTFLSSLEDQQVAFVARRGLCTSQSLPSKLSKADMHECCLLQQQWINNNGTHLYPHHQMSLVDDLVVDSVSDPRVIETYLTTAQSSKYNDDNPSFDMAVNGPFQGEFYEAMRTELTTIADDFRCWDLVPCLPGMNVLPSTWAFKIKRYPDGSVKKFKARFCARGDKQLEGIDYFETWAPVVQWSTIRIVLIMALKLSYRSAQCDITAAFIHAVLPDDEEIFIHQPRGFHQKHNHVLRLRRSLYGLKQAPRHFFQYLTERLLKQGFQQSIYDPCLFFTASMIVVVYVDDLLIFAKTDNLIDSLITCMQKEDICLRKEGTAEGYLGVDIKHVDGKLQLTQPGLSERIVKSLGLNKHTTSCKTPAETNPLPRDVAGDPASGIINYASVVGMFLYLSGHTRPDLSFAVHQCARYTVAPTKRHEQALLRIGRYLLGTMTKGIYFDPSNDISLDCYPDADFAGLWNHEHPDDPHCVRSRTGYVITLAHCPVIWASKMQTEIALSTMEAEYIALSTSCRDLFPLMDKLIELTSILDLPFVASPKMHVRIHKDNAGALVLGQLEPRRMTPRSKHYAVKYHWFREHIAPRNIELVKIDTASQLGDIFTKGLGPTKFTTVRKQLMGW